MFSTRKRILILNNWSYHKAMKGIGELSGEIPIFFSQPEKFGMVLFTGGADVSPELYKDKSPLGLCHANKDRDEEEIRVFEHACKHNIPMVGICRGAQFLNVMSGGTLLHDITGHNIIEHPLRISHPDWTVINVNSLHHQMIIPPPDGYIIGDVPIKLSKKYIGYHDQPVKWPGKEVEAILIPKTKCIGVQYHPEMMSKETGGYKFFQKMVTDFLEMDLTYFTQIYTAAKELNHVR